MKTLFSLPKDDGFFNRYATLIPTLRRLGILSQIINAVTEVGVIYAIVYSLLAEFWGQYAAPLAVAGAVLGTGIIELGLRKFLPYSARAILFRRFAGLDAWMTGFILATCFALFTCSLALSFKGSKAMVEAVTPPPAMRNTAEADSAFAQASAGAVATFRRDSAEVAARYAPLIEAQAKAYAAKIGAERQALAQLTAKERKTGQSFNTQRAEAQTRIAALEAEKAGKVAELQTAKAAELAAAAERRNATAGRLGADHAAARNEVTTANAEAVETNKRRVTTYGSGLAWFTLVFHFVLILAVALDEIHKKGAGIEQVAQPTQYDFSPSILSEFSETAKEKWNYYTRTAIRRWAERTPPPPRPTEPPTLYELADWKPRRVTLPTVAAELAGARAPDNGNGKHAGAGGNGSPTKNLSADDGRPVSATIPAEEEPPVNNATRYATGAQAAEQAPAVVEVDPSLKPCAHCTRLFRPRTTWQKFCSEPCKLAHHEQRHGAKFDPKQYRQRQR